MSGLEISATIDRMRCVRISDAGTGRCLLVHAFDRREAIALAVDAPAERLAVLLSDGTLVIFERHERDGLTWFQPARSYPGPAYDEYRTTIAFDPSGTGVLVTEARDTSPGASESGGSRAYSVEIASAVARERRPQSVDGAGPPVPNLLPGRIEIGVSAARSIVITRNAGAKTGRITGAGLMAFWDDAGIVRFEFDFKGAEVRLLGVREHDGWLLLGTSTLDALDRDEWYALAAALGAFYDGGVHAFERDVVW
jgi:hypothetical protein